MHSGAGIPRVHARPCNACSQCTFAGVRHRRISHGCSAATVHRVAVVTTARRSGGGSAGQLIRMPRQAGESHLYDRKGGAQVLPGRRCHALAAPAKCMLSIGQLQVRVVRLERRELREGHAEVGCRMHVVRRSVLSAQHGVRQRGCCGDVRPHLLAPPAKFMLMLWQLRVPACMHALSREALAHVPPRVRA